MIVSVSGGRNISMTPMQKRFLTAFLTSPFIEKVLVGCAKGVDESVRVLCAEKKIPFTVYKADWDNQGKSAGPIRNARMAKDAHICILFPGGIGTRNMKQNALQHGKLIIEVGNI